MSKFVLYTRGIVRGADRTFLKKPFDRGNAAWAYILVRGEQVVHEDAGREPECTVGRIHLCSMVQGFSCIASQASIVASDQITVVPASEYIESVITEGTVGTWQRNNWNTKTGKPVPDKDMWQKYLELKNQCHNRGVEILWGSPKRSAYGGHEFSNNAYQQAQKLLEES